MSGSDSDRPDLEEPEQSPGEETAVGSDGIDEELMALAPPPPSLRQALFILFFLALSGFMLVWFSPELLYLLQSFAGPRDLGEAQDADDAAFEPHTFVTIDGLPMVNRTLVFNEGVKWFAMSDNEKKMFPLSGKTNVFIQWTVPDEHKAYGAKPPVPSHFEGHMVDREGMGENFEKVWPFFDCLEVHPINRCKYCLGRDDLDQCRDAFTCVERNSSQECGQILTRTRDALEEAAAKGGPEAAEAREILAARREHEVAVASVRLDELSARAEGLKGAKGLDGLDPLRARILEMQLAEARVRSSFAFDGLDSLPGDSKERIAASLVELNRLKEEEPKITERIRTLKAFVEVGDELERVKQRCDWVRKKIPDLEPGQRGLLEVWDIDPEKAAGKVINERLGSLEGAIAAISRDRAAMAAGGDAGAPGGRDAGVADGGIPREEPARYTGPDSFDDPLSWKVFESLGRLRARAQNLQKKIRRVEIGKAAEFEKWATRTTAILTLCRGEGKDQCKLPDGLRAEEVATSLEKLEGMLLAVDGDDRSVALLATRINDDIDLIEANRKRIKELEAVAGVRDMEVAGPARELAASAKEALGGGDLERARRDLTEAKRLMMEGGFWPAQFRGVPGEMEALEGALDTARIDAMEADLDELSRKAGKRHWVVLDGEVPSDKIWVVLVYLLLGAMIVVNARKLWRFWVAFRA